MPSATTVYCFPPLIDDVPEARPVVPAVPEGVPGVLPDVVPPVLPELMLPLPSVTLVSTKRSLPRLAVAEPVPLAVPLEPEPIAASHVLRQPVTVTVLLSSRLSSDRCGVDGVVVGV